MQGGAGNDTYVVDNAGDKAIETDGNGTDLVESSVSFSLAGQFIENLTMTGSGNINATGNSLDNIIVGNAGKNVLDGGGGDDTLFIDAAGDVVAGETYAGGSGTDTLESLTASSEVNLTAVTLSSVENLVGFIQGVLLTSAQLDAFHGEIFVGNFSPATAVRISDGGTTIDISDADLVSRIQLAAGGNNLTFTANGVGSVQGVGGNDTITALGGVAGSVGATLAGGGGKDTLTGSDGDDLLRISAGDVVAGEVYDGRGGEDSLQLLANANLAAVTLSNLENLVAGGAGANVTMTASQLDQFNGEINLNGGAITLSTGGAINVSDAELHSSVNLASTGSTFTFTDGGFGGFAVTITGGNGRDTVTALGGTVGAPGVNLLGGGNTDALTGGVGNDQLTGGAGLDTLHGGSGGDTFVINAGSDVVVGETYDGGSGSDELLGNTGDEVSFVGTTLTSVETILSFHTVDMTAAQLDQFTGTIDVGTIKLATGGSIDISDALLATGQIELNAAGNSITIFDDEIAPVIIGNDGNDTVTVLGGDPAIIGPQVAGQGGDDTLTGGGSMDSLLGGAGRDTLHGGAGKDTLLISDPTDVVAGEIYDGGGDTDQLQGGAFLIGAVDFSAATLTGLEILTSFEDGVTLTAAQLDQFNNRIDTGNLSLSTGGSVDVSDAVLLSKVFLSAAGNAFTFSDPSGVDRTITITGLGGNDTITALGGNAAFEGALLNAGGGNDTLNGSASQERLTGGAGKDTIHGGLGDDTLVIASASEIVAGELYDGGGDHDALSVIGTVNLTSVTISSVEDLFGANTTMTAAQLDQFTGSINGAIKLSNNGPIDISGADLHGNVTFSDVSTSLTFDDEFGVTITGGGSGDTIVAVGGNSVSTGVTLKGGSGTDTLTGGASKDILEGDAKSDTLTGGAGADQFVFVAPDTASVDTIADFSGTTAFGGGAGQGDDLVFDGLLTGTFVYRGSAAFTGGSDNTEARVDAASHQVQVDTDGNGATDITITLNGLTSAAQLTAADFAFI
jgi:Ca2+-binding RTX toxin-like protein